MIFIPRPLHPHVKWWLQEDNVLQGQPPHPLSHTQSNFYRCIQRRLDAHVGEHTARGTWFCSRKQVAFELSGTKCGLFDPKRVLRPLFKQNCTPSNRQHHSHYLYKQRRRHEVRPTVCPIVENTDLVLQEASDSQGSTHSWPSECGSRQAIQTGSDLPNRGISSSDSLLKHLTLALVSCKRRHEINAWLNTNVKTLDRLVQCVSLTPLPALFRRIRWLKRAKTVWPQWLFQSWHQLGINH